MIQEQRENRWQLHRAGLINFWYYDDEEFHFARGRLLLRGANGSGKSVTMQSLIPLLLDGRKSPERLDPFGSRARRIDDYLLGEKDVVDREERTGYLFLEFKRVNNPRYLTVGIGLRARRHSSAVDFWGFLIQDGRRIGHDFFLYKREKGSEGEEKIPLTKRELARQLEEGGRLVETQREYMEMVNKHLFGFPSREAYEELIRLLLQLRSPKLSREFKPTVIYEILREALPALQEEELRPLADTIDNMDQIRQQLEQLQSDKTALDNLCEHYHRYNSFLLGEKARLFLESRNNWRELEKQGEHKKKELGEQEGELEKSQRDLRTLEQEQSALAEEVEELRQHDVFQAEETHSRLLEELERNKGRGAQKEKELARKKQIEGKIIGELGEKELEQQEQAEKIKDLTSIMEDLAGEAGFYSQAHLLQEFQEEKDPGATLQHWSEESGTYQEQLGRARQALEKRDQARSHYQETDRELGTAGAALDQKQEEARKWEEFLEEEKEGYLQSFHSWLKHNQYLCLGDEEIRRFTRGIDDLFISRSFEEVREPVRRALDRAREQIYRQMSSFQQEIQLLQARQKEKEEQIAELGREEPHPPRADDTEQTRQELRERGVPHMPLYAGIRFRGEIEEHKRERVESALREMGLLDALVVPSSYQDLALEYDRIIHPEPLALGYNLGMYLEPELSPEAPLTGDEMARVLASIPLGDLRATGERALGVSPEGKYHIALLQGHAPREEKGPLFLGRAYRRRYQQRLIAAAREELEKLQGEQGQLEEKIEALQEEEKALQVEYKNMPDDGDLQEVHRSLQKIRQEVRVYQEEVDRKTQKTRQALQALQEQEREVQKVTRDIDIALTVEAFRQAGESMVQYREHLYRLQQCWQEQEFIRRRREDLQVNREDIQADIDTLRGELNLQQDEEQRLKLRLEKVKRRLQELGAEEIRNRVQAVQKRLGEVEGDIRGLDRKIAGLQEKIEGNRQQIKDLTRRIDFAGELVESWGELLEQELKLGLVYADYDQADREKLARKIIREQEGAWGNRTLEQVSDRVKQVFFQEQTRLLEYRMTMEEVEMPGTAPEPASHHEALQVEALEQKRSRRIIALDYQGQKVGPHYVQQALLKDIEVQELVLSDKDRELYEEIIMNNIGRIIRARIMRARDWVRRMNRLMQKQSTSSGITFSLHWKPRPAQHQDEMDASQLVELLLMDPRLLKDEDMVRITRHFRNRIQRARQELQEGGAGETLHQVIREVLDYRQWFYFTLHYQRGEERKKELTNNAFYIFSGGEKALAMYIPLFSAAYSRYQEARADAPFIITLDEAFAGVDESNIRDMFTLLEGLDFDYIINSQNLWGDYDTVSSLAISELVRYKNDPFVMVIRYFWDGRVKHLVDEEMLVENRGDGIG